MADSKISDLNAATSIVDADLLTIVQSGSNKKMTYEVFKTTLGFLKKKVTVSSAQLLTLGSVPVEIIAAPGTNKYINIHSLCCSYNYNSVVYDYSSIEYPIFQIGNTNIAYLIPESLMNGAADFNIKLHPWGGGANYYSTSVTNTALSLKTFAGTDPTQGNGDLDVVVYYSIEDVNT